MGPALLRPHLQRRQGQLLGPPLDRLHPKNYRGLCLAEAVPMVFLMGLLHSLSDYVSQHNPLTSAHGACLGERQPFDTVYTRLSYIQHPYRCWDNTQSQRKKIFILRLLSNVFSFDLI
jgi:hypothetical protein